jgi:2-polyprenyl-6-methoxyphenol hydroxylase-like FAD-dependent oxidoreductase
MRRMMGGMQADTVIVGAGIGGLSLAHALARAGHSVVVVERNPSPPMFIRPELLWPATVSWLETLLSSEIRRNLEWLPLEGIRVTDGDGVWETVGREAMKRSGIQPLSTHPARTRQALWETAAFPILGGALFEGFERDSRGNVQAVRVRQGDKEFVVETRRVVADDGAQSPVRKAAGLDFPLHEFELSFVIFEAKPFPEFPRHGHLWRPRQTIAEVAAVAVIPYAPEAAMGLAICLEGGRAMEEVWRDLKEARVPHVASLPENFQKLPHYVPRWGHAPVYGKNGVGLMGDAAHPVSPAGGQGANMSVADARVLADAILHAGDCWVDAYEAVRRRPNGRSMRFTHVARFFQKNRLAGFTTGFADWFTHRLARHPSWQARLLRQAATAFQ